MATDKYLHIFYYPTADEFYKMAVGRPVVAFDNVPNSTPLASAKLPRDGILLFGAEGPGLSPQTLSRASQVVAIEQFGSTRSINVGVAAGIAMYAWLQQNYLIQ